MRRNPTPAEERLWLALRRRQVGGLYFRRQHPVGIFILDFVCLDKKLVVELDGSSHVGREGYDEARTERLAAFGYRVLRFRNADVLHRLPHILGRILQTAAEISDPRNLTTRATEHQAVD